MGISELILESSQFESFSKQLGAKTLNLKKLVDTEYNVPKFVAIPSGICTRFFSSNGEIDEAFLADIAQVLKQKLSVKKYAVRSSALVEDQAGSSLAGQFKTELDVDPQGLEMALKNVVGHAYQYLQGDLKQFSVLIQEFIEPDFAGVIFTRNPQGGRESVLEYHQGRGEDLVSGKIQPTSVYFLSNNCPPVNDLPEFEKEVSRFMKMESLFGFAQDVEWCVKDNNWFYLQARPITSINGMQYQQSLYLDQILPKENFLFEKNEVSEIAPTPSPFTWSLLEKIYAADGPIAKVYQKYGIYYSGEQFIVRIGNELFVDRELEIKNLLPSYSYFGKQDYKIHFVSFKHFIKTVKNIFALQRISLSRNEISALIQQKLGEKKIPDDSFEEMVKDFLSCYELIFEINLLADKALKILTQGVQQEGISIPELLSSNLSFIVEEKENFVVSDMSEMKGNALEISNEEDFIYFSQAKKVNEKIEQWWKIVPSLKKPYFQKIITQAVRFSKLREYGRWLTVKEINRLRNFILTQANQKGFQDVRNIYFANIDEILAEKISEEICVSRKNDYQNLKKYSFPSRLSSKFISKSSQLKGVSAGKAAGKLINADQVSIEKSGILYTKMLVPELTQYFGKITGIVSEEGGLLSHLAIMARENHLPVVVGFDLQKSGIQIGDSVEIDGGEGIVVKKS